MASYYVVGGEYADTAFTVPAAGTQLEIHGPFNERDAKVRWRELTGKTVDNAMVRYFLKSEDEITPRKYWVVGGEYADTSFTRMQAGKEVEVYGPFNEWDSALGFWRGLTSKSVDDAQVRYDIRENYQPGDDLGSQKIEKNTAASLHAVTKSVAIAAAPEKVFAYVADVRTWPKWASHSFKSVRPGAGGVWEIETAQGPARLTLKNDPALGVIDHIVSDNKGNNWSIPGRVVPAGGGAVVMLTFAKPATFSDAQFAQDLRMVDEELAALKRLLESAA
jgi:hypothetical protein